MVIVGYSKPYVALLTEASDGTATYSSGQALAKGVSVDISLDENSDNNFYADDEIAESDNTFPGGTLTATVDGLNFAARRMILGYPEAETVNGVSVSDIGNNAIAPYVGFGCIIMYKDNGIYKYRPMVLKKVKFNEPNTAAETKGETINYQSETLTASIERLNDENNTWAYQFSQLYTTKGLALAALTAVLGPAPDPEVTGV